MYFYVSLKKIILDPSMIPRFKLWIVVSRIRDLHNKDKESKFRMSLEGKSLKGDFMKFIIPSIAAQWVFALYTMVDGIFVARGVSEVALTAVNISMPFSVGMFSLSLMFAVGNSTIVAIKLGQGKKKEADELFTQNIVLMTIVSILISVLVLTFLEPFARFLGATDNILPYAKDYIGTVAPFAFAFSGGNFSFVHSSFLVGISDSLPTMNIPISEDAALERPPASTIPL